MELQHAGEQLPGVSTVGPSMNSMHPSASTTNTTNSSTSGLPSSLPSPTPIQPTSLLSSHSMPGLLGAPNSRRQTAEVSCPRSMVGRVIGRSGETIKALQTFTGALIQIDQSTDPTRVTISGTPQSLSLAVSMVTDICKGTFKGFALLRQLIQPRRPGSGQPIPARPVYAPGYGLIPPSQLYGPDETQVIQTTQMPIIASNVPQATLLQQGYQYVQTTPMGETQIVLQGMQRQDGSIISAMPIQQGLTLQQIQQVPMQQVYAPMSLAGHNGVVSTPYTTQVATYYPASSDYGSSQAGAPLIGTSLPTAGNTATQMLGNAGGTQAGGSGLTGSGAFRNSTGARQMGMALPGGGMLSQQGGNAGGGSGWIGSGVMDNNTIGAMGMSELLGNNNGMSNQLGAGLANASGMAQSNNLFRVVGPEGNVSYYLQNPGSDNSQGQNLR